MGSGGLQRIAPTISFCQVTNAHARVFVFLVDKRDTIPFSEPMGGEPAHWLREREGVFVKVY
jgi:hypothetical protein